MLFRTALLLIVWLLAYRLISGVLRHISSPGRPAETRRSPESSTGAPRESGRKDWQPSDVIDVPFKETPVDPEARTDGDRASSQGS